MIYDPDKRMTVVYNELSLPREIVINNTSAKAKNYYTYSTTGVKLKTVSRRDESLQAIPVTGTRPDNDGLSPYKTTDYVGNFIYENNNLKRILIDNGYIEDNNYYFYVRDHLGNNRIVADSKGSVLQSVQYYPFGLEFAGGLGQGLQPYKYGDKELDSDHNLNLYDFSARYFDPAVPRFTTVDPMAEKYYSWSPYVYVMNNPLKYIDPDGEAPKDVLRGFVQGYTGFFKTIGHAVSHPIETFNQAVKAQQQQTVGERFGNALMNAADMSTMGAASRSVDFVKALATDINGGDGSATGEVLGRAAAEGTVAVATAKIGEGVGKVASRVTTNTGKAVNATDVLKSSDILRIENAATRINKPINVVGSRANGTAGANSDWDYVIDGINSKNWSKIKNSLPGSKSVLDNTPRNIDLIKTPLDKTKPYITINPRP